MAPQNKSKQRTRCNTQKLKINKKNYFKNLKTPKLRVQALAMYSFRTHTVLKDRNVEFRNRELEQWSSEI
jgi:hypothetical protein